MHLLEHRLQRYAWGSTTALPRLLGVEPDGEPQAELWFGAHPSAPALAVTDDGPVPLDVLVREDADRVLGRRVRERFGRRLPYLLKVLAVERPLSLQVHPDAEQARRGYDREERLGPDRDDPCRTYRDPFAKPETVMAVGPFEALCGLRSVGSTRALIASLEVPGLAAVTGDLDAGADEEKTLAAVLHRLLRLDAGEAAALVPRVAAACRGRLARGTSPDPVADRLVVRLAQDHPDDPGVLVALLMTPVELAPGEALHLCPGSPHAYVHGTAVELMVCSDNVLRAGLTSKHVDLDGVEEVVVARPGGAEPAPVTSPWPGVRLIVPGVDEYALARVDLAEAAAGGDPVRAGAVQLGGGGPRTVLCLRGTVELVTGDDSVPLGPGRAALVTDADGPAVLRGDGLAVVAHPGCEPLRVSPGR